MLSKIRLENYKSIKQLNQLELKPITLISGENSSGKSSILQSILILKQTLESSFSKEPLLLNGEYVSVGEFKDVLFAGASEEKQVIKMGFDIKKYQEQFKETKFPSRFSDKNEIHNLSFDIKLKEANKNEEKTLGKVPILVSSSFKVNDRERLKIESDDNLLKELKENYNFNIKLKKEVSHNREIYNFSSQEKENLIKGVKLNKFFPESFITEDRSKYNYKIYSILSEIFNIIEGKKNFRYFKTNEEIIHDDYFLYELTDKMRKLILNKEHIKPKYHTIFRDSLNPIKSRNVCSEELTKILKNVKSVLNHLKNSDIQNYLFNNLELLLTNLDEMILGEIKKLLNECLEELSGLEKSKSNLTLSPITSRNFLVPFKEKGFLELDMERVHNQILNEFKNIFYLGPLRDEPRVFYRRTGSSNPMYVGQKGENLAFVLKYYSGKVIKTVLPIEKNENEGHKVQFTTLGKAISKWINYLGIAKDIKVEELGNIGLTIRTNIHGDKESDLMNVGVGVSQVLPIIVLGLASPENATLLLEQPELHLHPYIQSKLGDFFLALSQLGKQIIAETHSEYLINRMRYHVANQNLEINDDLSIYFMERSKENDCSKILKINIDKYGAIDQYPKGFFDETEKQLENIMNAAFDSISKEEV